MPRRDNPVPATLATATTAASAVVWLTGWVVLIGWWLDVEVLRSVFPGLIAMNPATAIAFLLAGTSLYLQRSHPVPAGWRLPARACAAVVLAAGVLVLGRYLWSSAPALDQLLFRHRLMDPRSPIPNRMAPNTALSFLLLGAGLLTLDSDRPAGRWLAQFFAASTGLIATVALLGYAYSSRPLYGIGPFIPMALNTATAFLLLAAGLLCARPNRRLVARLFSPGSGGVLARTLLPGAVLMPLLLGWVWLAGNRAGLYDTEFGVALLVALTIGVLAALMWRTAGLLDRADAERERAEGELRRAHDELELRVAERTVELRRTAEELRALVEASPLAICGLAPDGRVQSWNAAAERIFGYSADEVVGRALPIVVAEHAEELAGVGRGAGAAPVSDVETSRRHKDGRMVDVSLSTATRHDERGAPSGLVAVYTDITARKALEAQFRQAQKMEAVGRLAGGVAHDFNNVLTVITTQTELMLAELGDPHPNRADLLEIQGAANRAAAFTRQLLAFSRQQILQPKVIGLNSVISGMESLLRRLVGEDVAVVTKLDPDLASIWADPGQIQQVIMNLAVNARDAMPSGGSLLIETANVELDGDYPSRHPSARSGPHVQLSVTDTGCGMDPVTQARIFEPFFTTKEAGKGTGLGLSTVYGVVKQSGGHIWVYSEVGRGTTFKIYFLPHRGTAEPLEPLPPPATGVDGGATILLVEDEPAVRRAVRRVLERYQYRVLEAGNGQEALDVAAAQGDEIDLVLSDMVMPGIGGMDLADRLRALAPAAGLLLMTGYTQEAIARAGAGALGEALIEKPFTLPRILEKVREVLERRRPRG